MVQIKVKARYFQSLFKLSFEIGCEKIKTNCYFHRKFISKPPGLPMLLSNWKLSNLLVTRLCRVLLFTHTYCRRTSYKVRLEDRDFPSFFEKILCSRNVSYVNYPMIDIQYNRHELSVTLWGNTASQKKESRHGTLQF